MTLGAARSVVVQVQSHVVPAGGMLTTYAHGFGSAEPLTVHLDGQADHPLAVWPLTGTDGHLADARVPIPSSAPPGPHLLTFVAGDRDFDLLIEVLATSARAFVRPRRVRAGDDLDFEVSGFGTGTGHVKLDGEGDPLPFALADDGTGTGRVTVPPDTAPGPHHLRFLCAAPPTSTLEGFVVVGDDEPGGGEPSGEAPAAG